MKFVQQKIFSKIKYITLIIVGILPLHAFAQNLPGIATTGDRLISSLGPIGQLSIGILYTLMTLVAGLLGIAGLILNGILKISVTDLSTRLSISSIETTWRVLRDLANMSFIFILLYEGIRMILGLEGSNVKKVLSGIIIAAILINFSLFATKVVIDASNIITLGFYNSIVSAGDTSTGLSGMLMNVLQIGKLYNAKVIADNLLNSGTGAIILTANIIFLLIATFVFLSISVMFVIRYLSFILLLIMSPLAFASIAIPGLNKIQKKYVETLINQALFAPVFMLLVWVLLTLAGDKGFLTSISTDKTWMQIFQGRTDDEVVSTIIDYILITGLLLYTLILSKKVATEGGFITNSMINKGTSLVGGAMFGGAALAGRQVIGKRATEMAEDKNLQKRADEGDIGARLQLGTAKYLSKSTFDARRGALVEKANSFMGVDMGSGLPFKPDAGKGGYAGEKAAKKKETEGKLDEIIKRHKDKNDWRNMADVFSKRSSDEQKYIYKNLSAKDRIGLEKEMGGIGSYDVLRGSLGKEEQDKTEEETIKYYANNKDWRGLITYFSRTGTTSASQQFIYNKLSARDRVAFGKELNDQNTINALNNSLTPEELDKTKEVAKKVERQERDEQHIREIEVLAAPGPIAPSQAFDALLVNKTLSTKNARNLSEDALQNPEIIKRLKPEHLKDIQENADISDATKKEIMGVIQGTVAYGNQQKQLNYINKNQDYWI